VLEFSLIQKIAIWALPVLFAITVHEVAHGWAALKLGDRTAQMMGRLTLNPIKHIDPVGTLLVPGLLLAVGGFIFGWAKPVPVTFQNLKNPKKDMAWVALAGPVSNLIMAIFWALFAKAGLVLVQSGTSFAEPMMFMGAAGVLINIILFALNLLPVPPLDGSKVLMSFLPGPLAWKLSRIEPYGFFILIALLYFGVLSMILGPVIGAIINVLAGTLSLPPQLFYIF
jgi:Zn-dependent protease